MAVLHKKGKNLILVTVTVLGSAGPIRFLVNQDKEVGAVIQVALDNYAREGRLPVLGSKLKNFLLYCPYSGNEALNYSERIGSVGGRNFVLYKKKPEEVEGELKEVNSEAGKKANGSLKAWINRSLGFMIHSH